jgi:transcriptional regulator with XRE-family HTH domain
VTYGARLRELRAERQLSLREVEERGGPNKDTMSLIERGVHKPQPQTFGRIAKALGMGVAELRSELEAAERPLAEAPPSQQLTLNGLLTEERRAPTFVELHAIETLKDYCNRLEEFLSAAKQTKIARTLWFMEADTAINMAALSLPLAEREYLRPQLLPTAARLVELAHEVFDGARNAGAVVPEDASNVIDMVERVAS